MPPDIFPWRGRDKTETDVLDSRINCIQSSCSFAYGADVVVRDSLPRCLLGGTGPRDMGPRDIANEHLNRFRLGAVVEWQFFQLVEHWIDDTHGPGSKSVEGELSSGRTVVRDGWAQEITYVQFSYSTGK